MNDPVTELLQRRGHSSTDIPAAVTTPVTFGLSARQDGRVPDYDLTRLGTRAFEQMIVSLAHNELGPGVQAFGDGRDGGREATCDMPIDWSKTVVDGGAKTKWDGYTVFQAKFQVKPQPQPLDNAVWLQKEIGSELQRWIKAKIGNKRDRYPDQLVFVTNVDLSPVAKIGGIDTLHKYVRDRIGPDSDAERAGLKIKDFRIWHADQIRTMLDSNQSVRWAYPGLLSVGDILSLLADRQDPRIGNLGFDDPLRDELLRSLSADQWVRLGQAGAEGDEKLLLHDVLIYLPTLDDEERDSKALREVFALGDCSLRRREPDAEAHPGLVFVGGPGQGKSTISQAVAQAYRASLLKGADLAPTAADIVDATERSLQTLGLTLPSNRRWPVRVDLAKYAEELTVNGDVTLLRWIASESSKRIETDLTPSNLRSWLLAWPWVLVLDGLDEVPSAESRSRLRRQIEDLLVTAEDVNADLLVVVTTRPTGYDERFAADFYRHLSLTSLSATDASKFAEKIVSVRFSGDPEMHLQVANRMTDASTDPSTRRLMRTPLQVTIMSVIVEKFPNLPPDRFNLFDLYYSTIFEREIGKEIPVARFLANNRQQIDRLHEAVGLRLQVLAENAGAAEAVLSAAELQEIVKSQLASRGFEEEEANSTSEALVEAAMKRLVLLVPRAEGVGFEVRTLQELMAARAITSAADDSVRERLETIAHSPHWRNTWLLAAGRLLASSERFEQAIAMLLRGLDTDPRRLASHFPTAPMLAAELLEDNLAFNRPKFERALVQLVISILDFSPTSEAQTTAVRFLPLLSGPYWQIVVNRLAASTAGNRSSRAAAFTILDRLLSYNDVPHRGSLTGLLKLAQDDDWGSVQAWLEVTFGVERNVELAVGLGEHLQSRFAVLADPPLSGETFERAMHALNGGRIELPETDRDVIRAVRLDDHVEPTDFASFLEDEDQAIAIETALQTIHPSDWTVISMLGAVVRPHLIRRPVGPSIWDSVRATAVKDSDY